MVHEAPGRPNAKMGGCGVGLHTMPILAVALAVGIFACNSCARTAKSAKHPCQHFLNRSAAKALSHTSHASPLGLLFRTAANISSSGQHDHSTFCSIERDDEGLLRRRDGTLRRGARQAHSLQQSTYRRRRGRRRRRESGRRRAAGGRDPIAKRGRRGRRHPGRRGLRRGPRRGPRRHACASGVYKTNFTTPPRRRHDVRSTTPHALDAVDATHHQQLVRAQATAVYAAPPMSRRLCSRESSTKVWMLWRRRL